MSDVKAVHAFVSGRVQGVNYRYATWTRANELGLTGWVQNLPDGRVEVWAQGDAGRVDALVEFLWRGPRLAVVQDVDAVAALVDHDIAAFQVR